MITVNHHPSIALSTLLSLLYSSASPFSSLSLSSLCSVLPSCFLHFPFLFSFLFTLPCSASTLPWQRPYRKSLLPRPHERNSFHRRRRDGEMEGERSRVFSSDWRLHPHLSLQQIHPSSIRASAHSAIMFLKVDMN